MGADVILVLDSPVSFLSILIWSSFLIRLLANFFQLVVSAVLIALINSTNPFEFH